MKSIKMTIKPNGELVLPEAHFSTLQGLFYELLSFDPVLSDEVHGMRSGKTDAIKQFCFSDLHYPCGSSRGSAFYKSSFTFEVRSANDPIIETIERSVNDDPLIVINGHECEIINYRVSSTVFLSNSFDMRMDSPITVYRSNKRRDYYSQSDPEFYEIVKNNLLKKYLLAYGEA